MCNFCGSPYPCTCIQQNNYPCNCRPTGTTYTLDFTSVIYHKSLGTATGLLGLNLPNGSNLETIIEAIDTKIRQLNVVDWTLTYLRQSAVINSVQSFAEKVDSVLGTIGYLGEVTSDPTLVDISNGQYWFRTDTDELKIKLDGATRVITIT